MARAQRRAAQSPDRVCPLFAEVTPPIYAKNVSAIRLKRFDRSTGSSRGAKVPLAKEDYYIDGDENTPFEINPYMTTEEDLQEQFGRGEYWIDAFDVDGKAYANGRRLVLDGPYKRGGVEVADPEDAALADHDPGDNGRAEMMRMMEKMLSDRENAARQQAEREREHAKEQVERERQHTRTQIDQQSHFTEAMFKMATDKGTSDVAPMELISALRSQMDSQTKKYIQDEEQLRRDHRNELNRQERAQEDERRVIREELTEERKRSREELARREQDYADLRRRVATDEDDKRRQYQKDLDDLRARYDRDLATARSETLEIRSRVTLDADTRVRTLQSENDDLKKQVRDLEREMIKLERELAKASVPDAEGPNLIEQFAPVMQKVIADVALRALQGPANNQQTQQFAQQQAMSQMFQQPIQVQSEPMPMPPPEMSADPQPEPETSASETDQAAAA